MIIMLTRLFGFTRPISLLNRLCRASVSSKSSNGQPPDDSQLVMSSNGSAGRRMPGAEDFKNPWEVLKYDLDHDPEDMIPRQTDTLIVGGGVIGWSVAYWLREMANTNITVVERDPSHSRSATVFSVGGIRQQFSEPENILMSLYSAEFLRNIREHLSVLDQDPPDIQFNPHGYLFLASQKGADQMLKNYEVQREYGAKVELLSKTQLKDRWPWLNVTDIEMGSYGYENEGWFDPWLLLSAFRRKACSMGVNFVQGEVTGFEGNERTSQKIIGEGTENKKNLTTALVRTPDNNIHPIKFSHVVNAAGPWAGEVARMAGIGTGEASHMALPVEPRRQHWYVVSSRTRFDPATCPGIDAPFLVDPSGVQMRRQEFGGDFLVFKDPPPQHDWKIRSSKTSQQQPSPLVSEPEPDTRDLEVDYEWFESHVWPLLAHRVPAMEALKVRTAWAGYYDYNFVDQNLIIGSHPMHRNMLFVNGSSGHGIQHAVAIGRAMAEFIMFSRFRTIDLERFNFDRFFEDREVFEKNIV